MIRGDVFLRAFHRAAMIVGVLSLVAGFVVFFAPGTLSVGGLSGAFTSVIALVAFLLGLGILWGRYRVDEVGITLLPDPETLHASTTPGDDFDDMVYRLVYRREGTLEFRDQIRRRLRNTAIRVIASRDDCPVEEAEAQLEAGTWTDHAGAAAYFSEGIETAGRTSLPDRLLARIAGERETGYERRVDEVVDAIYRERFPDVTDLDGEEETPGFGERLAAAFRRRASLADERREVGERDEGELVAEGVTYQPLVRTGRWAGVTAFALIAIAAGVLTLRPTLLLASGVAVVFAGVARMASPPPLADLQVTRRLSTTTPTPGDEVEVTVTVENTGNTFLTDLRLVDRVPPTMAVVDGSPRVATALRAGDATTFSYTIVAERGEYEWPLTAIGRDVSGMVEREATIEAEGTLRVVPPLRTMTEMPVRSQTSEFVGQVDTGMGGAGVEFFSTRDYRPGDPMNRIDWSRHARTGELSTIEFREERAANVVLLFETRESAYAAPRPDMRSAVNRAADAADDVFAALLDGGNLVGLAAFDTLHCWLGPGAGDDHRQRARQLFASHPALSPLPPSIEEREGGGYIDPMTHVRAQLPASTQIVLFTPLTDDFVADVAQRLDTAGHLVTIISPDATATGTAGQRLARVERAMRITRLRERGIRVIDWREGDPIELELRRSQQRWQQI